jgi:amino acid transporter
MITCLFGAAYIILGNMAGNCLVFGLRCLDAAGLVSSDYDGTVRGIAVGVATFACLIHTVSRRGGIWLGNLFAVIKVLMLTLMVILGFCAWGGAFKSKSYADENMSVHNSFRNPSSEPYGYVSAFLAVIFAWSGFDQPTYVLGEIGTPRRKFPWGTGIGVAIVTVLYLLVNVAYMIVVPKETQINTKDSVALEFFKVTLGLVDPKDPTPQRVLAAFMAISSFGNIMVMTFVAARVKQEIAKEGVLPFARYFGSNTNLSLGRFLLRIQRKDRSFANRHFAWLLKQRWMSPSEHSQETPFGALSLHWLFTIVMIVATIRLKPSSAYSLLVNLYSYTVICIFGCLLSLGLLKLRFSRKEKWRKKSPANPFFSILAATLFFTGSTYPIIASCVPPTKGKGGAVPGVAWYTTPVVAGSILLFGLVWFSGFNIYASYRERKEGLEFRVQKVPEFDKDGGLDGLPVQVHETVYIAWAAKEANNVREVAESRSSLDSF